MRKVCYLQWLLLAVLVIVLDQVSKIYFNTHFSYGETVPVTPFFNWVLYYNPGAAFSFLAAAGGWQRHVFTVLALGVSAVLAWMIVKGAQRSMMNFACAFIMGGALGNVIDRIAYGHVVDFIQLYYGQFYWPAFNLADSAICIGAVLMVLDGLRRPSKETA